MHILNIVTSPRKEKSASIAIVDAFLSEYKKRADKVVVDTLDIWQERLPEFDAGAINAKYKGVSGEPMTPIETTTWEKIRALFLECQCGISLFLTSSSSLLIFHAKEICSLRLMENVMGHR
jgi:FMN-dependent NADH-azoreductase